MAYNKCNYFQARRATQIAANRLAHNIEQEVRLHQHLMLLDNIYAVAMAEMLMEYVEHGRRPDFGKSRVMETMFRKALAIVKS